MAHRMTEIIRETLSKKITSTVPLLWKPDIDKRITPTREGDAGPNLDETAGNTQMNQLVLTECNKEDTNRTKRDKKCLKAKNDDFLWF